MLHFQGLQCGGLPSSLSGSVPALAAIIQKKISELKRLSNTKVTIDTNCFYVMASGALCYLIYFTAQVIFIQILGKNFTVATIDGGGLAISSFPEISDVSVLQPGVNFMNAIPKH